MIHPIVFEHIKWIFILCIILILASYNSMIAAILIIYLLLGGVKVKEEYIEDPNLDVLENRTEIIKFILLWPFK